jgi:hypothetical protein
VRIFKLSGEEKVVSADKIDDNLVWWTKLQFILEPLTQ